jgi:hypothetical protein
MTTLKRNFQILALALVALVAQTSHAAPTDIQESRQLFFGPQKNVHAKPKKSWSKRAASQLLATPYKKVLLSLAGAGAFAVSKMVSNAWTSNEEKLGSERLRGFLADLKANGFGELFARARQSPLVQSALSSLATDAIMHTATKGLNFLAE